MAEVTFFADQDADSLTLWGLELGLGIAFSEAADKDLCAFGDDIELEGVLGEFLGSGGGRGEKASSGGRAFAVGGQGAARRRPQGGGVGTGREGLDRCGRWRCVVVFRRGGAVRLSVIVGGCVRRWVTIGCGRCNGRCDRELRGREELDGACGRRSLLLEGGGWSGQIEGLFSKSVLWGLAGEEEEEKEQDGEGSAEDGKGSPEPIAGGFDGG